MLRWRPRLGTWLLLSIGLWLMLRQVDGVLASLQREGYGGYGVNDLGPLSPAGIEAQVQAALHVWQADATLAHAAFHVYTALDFLFIAAYAGLLFALIRNAGAPAETRNWLLALIGLDVLENVLRTVIVATGSHGVLLVYASWFATLAKWVSLAGVLLLVAHARRQGRRHAAPGHMLWALWRLRIPLVLLGAFGLFLIFDPTGQSPDILRRWFDDPERFALALASTAGCTVLLATATWTTVRRAVLTNYDVQRKPHAWRWALAAAALGAISLLSGWANLTGFAYAILVVFALGLFALLLKPSRPPLPHVLLGLRRRRFRAAYPAAPGDGDDGLAGDEWLHELAFTEREDGRLAAIRSLARMVSAWPLLALLLALVSAWTAPPLVLLAQGHDRTTALLCAAAAFAALVATPLAAVALPWALAKLESDELPQGSPLRPERRHALVIAACLVLCGLAIWKPLTVPPALGAVGMLSVGIAVLVVVLGEGQRYGETHPAPAGLKLLGFDGLPVVALLVLAFALASLRNDGSYHRVARTSAATPMQAGTPLAGAFADWKARNCADEGSALAPDRAGAGGSERTIPMVLVASQGGGIRAAYWTTSVLSTLLGDPPPTAADDRCAGATPYDRVFALNGASGGSLGISSYAGNVDVAHAAGPSEPPWYRTAWGTTDLASVPTTWGLLVDLPRNLVGWDGPDRARRFEQAWERQDATLGADFFGSQASQPGAVSTPVLMHAGTQVESGCRMNVATVRLTAVRPVGRPGDCALLAHAAHGGATPPQTMGLPSAALTSDVLDYVCAGASLRRSSAALMSARFPYVSPSGQLERCLPGELGEREPSGLATAVVDGGYAENTGGQAILDLWSRLEPAVAAYNAKGPARIVPIFVDVDNHYAKAARVAPAARTPELLVPPLTAGRPDGLDDLGVEQSAQARFSGEPPGLERPLCPTGQAPRPRYVHLAPPLSPGIPAPLAWTLSDMAMDDLDRQREAAFAAGTPGAALRDVLRGAERPCEDASP